MKKLVPMIAFLLIIVGCSHKQNSEVLAMKCQKAKDYEFYNSMYIVGVYNTSEGEVTKIEVAETFIPKWDDVKIETLNQELETKKKDLKKQYEKMEFTIDPYKRNVTFRYEIPVTKKNLQKMKQDALYKEGIQDNLFSVVNYWSYLESNGYVCE